MCSHNDILGVQCSECQVPEMSIMQASRYERLGFHAHVAAVREREAQRRSTEAAWERRKKGLPAPVSPLVAAYRNQQAVAQAQAQEEWYRRETARLEASNRAMAERNARLDAEIRQQQEQSKRDQEKWQQEWDEQVRRGMADQQAYNQALMANQAQHQQRMAAEAAAAAAGRAAGGGAYVYYSGATSSLADGFRW